MMNTAFEKFLYVLETLGQKIAMMFEKPDKGPCGCRRHFRYDPDCKCKHPAWRKHYFDHGYRLNCDVCGDPHPANKLYPDDGGKNYE